ncbi:hypothetical protein G5I_11014 [Acromyrmex echinatior]|uniref:Uncharacterized protein n=1 Tax=Acromyrmex echinatior TaxID=103372 RepID=F4WYG4_ACREC|nr:hypothetical protein G5I_11014 [Acromyrmex echinatior]
MATTHSEGEEEEDARRQCTGGSAKLRGAPSPARRRASPSPSPSQAGRRGKAAKPRQSGAVRRTPDGTDRPAAVARVYSKRIFHGRKIDGHVTRTELLRAVPKRACCYLTYGSEIEIEISDIEARIETVVDPTRDTTRTRKIRAAVRVPAGGEAAKSSENRGARRTSPSTGRCTSSSSRV